MAARRERERERAREREREREHGPLHYPHLPILYENSESISDHPTHHVRAP
jgi:hypothetical protein